MSLRAESEAISCLMVDCFVALVYIRFATRPAAPRNDMLISILQYFLRREHPSCAHHSAAGVCACRAKVVTFERRAEVRPLRGGAQEEDLVQQQFAVKDVAARYARNGFDVLR